MKYIFFFLFFFFSNLTFSQSDDGCNISSKEKLVCEYIMCHPLGFVSDESRSKCTSVTRKFSQYVASLPPFKKPKKCYKRNTKCDVVGIMTNSLINPSYCSALPNSDEKEACNSAIGSSDEN